MPLYVPVEIDHPVIASQSDLISISWSVAGISADFSLSYDNFMVLRVTFDRQCIVRLLDEMALSTELDDGMTDGLRHEHFVYLLEGSAFAASQSEAWKLSFGPVSHWRFVTGWTCMDVLSAARPSFAVAEPGRTDSALGRGQP
jgi:hypothetical protein